MRLITSKLPKGKTYEFVCYLGGAIPLLLLITEVIHKSALNVILAGISMFYFAIIAGRKNTKIKH